jgi:biotin carboxylase
MGAVAGDGRERTPRLLVLGAGPEQLGVLEAARAHGIWTAVCDRDPAAPGFPLASRRCIVSIEDEAALERLAAALDLDGLIAPCSDRAVGAAARIAERLGLPHPVAPATAAAVTDRRRHRERLAEAGVPQPRWEVVAGGRGELGAPCVVKAPERHGGKGRRLVLDDGELPAAIEEVRALARGSAVLVEELVDGPEVAVSGFAVDGELIPLAVTDRVAAAEPTDELSLAGARPAFGVALAHVWPSPYAGVALEVARRAVEALGIGSGPTYTRLQLSRGGPEVLEVGARLGGGHNAELVQAVTGVDLNALALLAALGARVTADDVARDFAPRAGGAVTRFLVAQPGILESVEVPQGIAGVLSVRLYREPGHEFGPLRRAADRAGAVLAVGATREEAVVRADVAAERIRFATADAGVLA